ncbi:Outer membrane protein beta-barrel family protein [Alistipes timonensis JC136]|uniref:Outer membrane protein beta-barrel family protein n=1 Tax=Alistipes timonensis JC136 TaxID=1033731 RepID=A0A1H4BUQ3_9BACT|nr:outer membrane beta-barrel protein [Alistipes timonensis]SEA51829.1 Outer membrane protein beta-barrel family protein [Alistipes timonensis JC136]
MHPKKTLLLLFCTLCAATAAAQPVAVRFRVADRTTRDAVVGAVAELRSRTDTAAAALYTTSDIDGRGLFPRVPRGEYRLTVTSLGYDSLRTDLRVGTTAVALDSLWLAPRAETIDDVVVEVPALRSSVRGDTLSYRASAYKVSFGSDAGSLISKMPGLEIADGAIEAQGRSVQRVYVDGREFFGNDVMSAVRNIPADMIESIDIYNTQSDQSEFTGVDTGEGVTALNIVTLPDKRRGAFGRVFGAYGIPDKYIGGGNVNIFNNDRRISVIGLVNNVSRQNFSFEDILGTTEESNSRTSNKNFMVRPMDGISTVQAVGVNYSDDWGKKGKVTASYFFNRTDNHNTSRSDKQTFTASDKLVLYNDENRSKALNLNHRFNSRIDYRFSERHSMMMRTSFSLQDNNARNELLSRTDNKFSDDDIRFVNRRRNFGLSDSKGFNVSNNLIYRYRLPGKKSHNLTFGFGGTYRSYEQFSFPRQYTFRDPDDIECDTTDYSSRNVSRTDRDQPGYDVNGSASYTRALSKRSRLSLEYRINYTDNSVDRSTFVLTKENVFPDERNPKQSTEYDYAFLTHRVGSTYQYYFKKTKVAATLYYQHAEFDSDYAFPYRQKTGASFDNLTYNVVSNISITRNNTLKFTAVGRTSNPRATDLQGIVNTTNRQNVFAGNPHLDPVYTHRLTGQYIRTSPERGRTFTVSAEAALSPNTITDSLVIDTPDFVIDDEGTLLGEGNQFTKPVNLPGYWSLRASVNYGMPVRRLRSNLNFRAGVSTGRIPSIINGERNELSNSSYNAGVVLGSNISESVDFRVSYTGRYNVSKSTSHVRTLDNTYFSQTARAEATFVAWKRLVVRANADYNYYKGITDTFLEERLICNALLGVKLFRNRLGEVSVGVNDLLDQNGTTFRRTVTGTTLRNVTNLGVGRYVSLQLTYNLRLYRRQSNAVMDALQGK